jgi:hypothetical protein
MQPELGVDQRQLIGAGLIGQVRPGAAWAVPCASAQVSLS